MSFFDRNPSPISESTKGSPQTELSDIYEPLAALSRSIVAEPTEQTLPFLSFSQPTKSRSPFYDFTQALAQIPDIATLVERNTEQIQEEFRQQDIVIRNLTPEPIPFLIPELTPPSSPGTSNKMNLGTELNESSSGKKNMNMPKEFSGNRDDFKRWMMSCQMYIAGNHKVYPTDFDKINFVFVTGVTSLHSRSVLGRDSNKELSSIRAKGTSKGCEQSVVD